MVTAITKKILLLSIIIIFIFVVYIFNISQLVRIYYTSSVLVTVASSFACFAQAHSGRESGKIFL